MLRRTARLRKEYLYRKSLEEKERILAENKKRVREALDEGKAAPTDLRGAAALRVVQTLDLDDDWTKQTTTHIDDEYAFAGVEDPKVVITTSRNPSSRLQQFTKEFRLLIPNAQRVNRGGYVLGDLVALCRSNQVTDLIILHEHRGEPDGMIVCHLPHGPTAHFSLRDVALRHDLPDKPANMSEALPHLVFHNFTSRVGQRVSSILKYLFPPSRAASQRVHAFVNLNDSIHFRHYTWTDTRKKPKASSTSEEEEKPRGLELTEVGPRFTLKPFRIELGTVEMRDLESEWALRPHFNSAKAALA
ncbi:hypothetical protein Emed_006890 [Eimeria media]